MFQNRLYRRQMQAEDLWQFNVTEEESDLQILAKSDLTKEARRQLLKYRQEIKDYLKTDKEFLVSLTPIKPHENAPMIIRHMCLAAKKAGVGPMASVAGALALYVGQALTSLSEEIIIENGGDIYMKNKNDRRVLIYAGDSPLSNKIALLIPGKNRSVGIATSSGTVGNSLSFGQADAAVIVSYDVVLADAVATAVCNVVKDGRDIEKGLEFAQTITGVLGAVIIIKDKIGAFGDINLVHF